jgi:bacillithiol system protein YtxJ
MKWEELNDLGQLSRIDEESKTIKVLIFKHSTRCNISNVALERFDRDWKDSNNSKIKSYYLDLLNHRDISSAIADHYHIEHQSPQVLIISNGKCIYSKTHMSIQISEIIENI